MVWATKIKYTITIKLIVWTLLLSQLVLKAYINSQVSSFDLLICLTIIGSR